MSPKPDQSDHDLLIAISADVSEMKRRLFGNGQKGEIAEMDGRIDRLEKWKAIFGGGIAILAFLLGHFASKAF
ncbi:MAG: hypothetical protein GWN58_51275 [Anaerolineae bacterium]|nr:hypothetical protein [Anaerolineae bacterium]